jgi:tRNA(Arg) A34 adenosine deaminase TadA
MEAEKFIRQAIAKAEESVAKGGFPAGAVIVRNSNVVGEGISIGNNAKRSN